MGIIIKVIQVRVWNSSHISKRSYSHHDIFIISCGDMA